MKRDELRAILMDLSDKLGFDSKVKLELRRMKTKAASASIRRNVIRLNKELVGRLQRDSLRYLILHELVHLKLRSTYHDENFYNLIYSVFEEDRSKELEEEILAKLIELNKELGRGIPRKYVDPF